MKVVARSEATEASLGVHDVLPQGPSPWVVCSRANFRTVPFLGHPCRHLLRVSRSNSFFRSARRVMASREAM